MSMPPTGSGPYQSDGAAGAGAGPYQAPPATYGGHPYPQPGGGQGDAASAPAPNARALGWIGVAVLYALVVWQLLVPTVSTLVQSTTSGNPINSDTQSVGLQNWADMLPQLAPALGFGFLAVLPVTLAAAVLGFAIGGAMTPAQQLARPVRVVVGVLAALFVPLGIGLARFTGGDGIRSLEDARSLVIVSMTLALLPLLTAAFATAFAVVLAGRAPGRGIAAVLVLGLTGALALGPQVFDLPYVFTGGGPQDVTQTPMLLIYRQGFMMFEFGRGAAVGGAVLLLAGLLGIVAVLALLLLRVRLGVAEDVGPVAARTSGLAVIGAVIAGLVLVAAVVVTLPVLTGGFSPAPDAGISPVQVAIATWAPVAVGTLLQVGVAVLGGAAIGWCRPAGRRSLWLLLPLAPWLFVGPAPLMLARYEEQRTLGTLNTWVALIPGPVVVVGAVVVLALLFAGLREHRGRGHRQVLGAAAAGAAGVLLVTQAQSLLPALIVSTNQDLVTAPMALIRLVGGFGLLNEDIGWALGLLYPIPMLLVVVALGVLAQLGLRRVVLTSDQRQLAQPPYPQPPYPQPPYPRAGPVPGQDS